MSRFLWLVYEQSPHPDAVSYPAGEDDVRLVLELLAMPSPRRMQIAEQLRNFLTEQMTQPLFSRKQVPCRRTSGLYHLVPWRLAQWLSNALRTSDEAIRRTEARLRRWLENEDCVPVVSTDHNSRNLGATNSL